MAAPLDLRGSNFAPADTRTAVASALPIPPVPPNDPPVTFLQAARSALAGGRTGETQEALAGCRIQQAVALLSALHPGAHAACSRTIRLQL
jgi:hypothetical protein